MSPTFLVATVSVILALSATVAGDVLPAEKRSYVDISHRPIPWLDYEGIAAAAERSLHEDLVRKGLPTEDYTFNHLNKRQNTCASVMKRLEWRQLTDAQKIAYLEATKCLYSKNALGIVPDATTIIDEIVTVHNTKWQEFHGVPAFLPWHRWVVWIHEEAMKNECGYSGPSAYWNYTTDYADPYKSPIFDDATGFGSHGTTVVQDVAPGYRIDKGFFANIQVNVPAVHYITRNYTGWRATDPSGRNGVAMGNTFSPTELARVLNSQQFSNLESNIDTAPGGIHNGPHFMNMGDWTGPGWVQTGRYAGNSYAPNDPLFWPHHAYVDKVFWTWQQKPNNQFNYNGNRSDRRAAATSDLLPFYSMGPDLPVSAVLKTEDYPLCYTY